MKHPYRHSLSRWLPLGVMVLCVALRPTPLGVLLALVAGSAVQWLLARLSRSTSVAPMIMGDWRSLGPNHTALYGHASDQDRCVGSVGEIGMGGPAYWSVLLRDGTLLHDVCTEVHDLEGGNLRIALSQTRNGNPLLVYDAQAACIHVITRLDDGRLPEALFQAACQAPDLHAVHVRHACLSADRCIPLHTVLGLRVSRKVYPQAPAQHLSLRLRDGRMLQAQSLLPPDLRGADDPEALLAHAPYTLLLDGTPTDQHVLSLEQVHESPGGCIVALPTVQLDVAGRVADGCWHLLYQGCGYSVRKHATRSYDGGGSYTPFFLELHDMDDAGNVYFDLATLAFGQEGRLPSEPAPPHVELQVNWLPAPLRLMTEDNRIRIELPRA